jgi:hypothetical protein
MPAEFIVVGRRALPPGEKPWELVVRSAEGTAELDEAAARYEGAGLASVFEHAAGIVGWLPRSLVFVRKAWDLAQVAAEELALALDGAVFCDVDGAVLFEARGAGEPVASRQELAARLQQAFDHPQPFFERWRREEREREAQVAAANGEIGVE